jgi:two-component sensor histidine kinase
MRETLHRAKNQLAVVEGLARMTAKATEPGPAFLAMFSRHIQGLSITHRLLVESNWTGVNLHTLIQHQIQSAIPEADGFKLDGPDIAVRPEAAQTLGLAIHELAELLSVEAVG